MRFQIYRSKKQFRFRPVGDNGEIIGDDYHNKLDCEHAVEIFRTQAAGAEIEYLDGLKATETEGDHGDYDIEQPEPLDDMSDVARPEDQPAAVEATT